MIKQNRRGFIASASVGLAGLTLPGGLPGCARQDLEGSLNEAAPANPFMDWFSIDQALIGRVMAELSARGADHADLFFEHKRSNSIKLEDGLISQASTSIDQGVGLRVVVGDQVGYAFTEELSLEAMLGAARTAASIASGQGSPPPVSFSLREHPDHYRLELPWSQVGVDRKLPLLRKLEGLAKAKDPAIQKVGIRYHDSDSRILIATLDGSIHTDRRPMTRLWCQCTAVRGGQTVSQGANLAGRRDIGWYTDERLQTLAKLAVDRTIVLFDAIRPPAGEMPVILAAGASGILLHEAIGHGMEADFNRKGVSIYSEMMGQRIAPDFVDIVDNGLQKHERGALNIDDEGNPTERTVLVRQGVLNSYLHDRISAKHYGTKSTGSGRRQSFRHVIQPRMRSTYMEDGPHTKEEIIASVKKGIIAETYTNGQVQIGAGDFTFYVKNGWLVEDGKVTAPIKDVNIIGNGPETLRKVTMAAADSHLDTGGWTCGKNGQGVPVSQGMPTVLVSSMTVGGVSEG
jgi:TldD protein